MNKPKELNICGIPFNLTYCDNLADVDLHKRETLYGQIDLTTQSIRIYDDNCNIEFIWKVIIHEVLHAIGDISSLDMLDIEGDKGKHTHNELNNLAAALTDFLFRNNLIKIEKE